MERKSEPEMPLDGQCILVAEDEFLIASAIEELLRAAGAETRRAASVRAALQDLDYQTPSAALLDVRLGHQTTEAVADILAERGVPFLFYSGHGLPDEMREKHPDTKVLLKPVPPRAIIDEVARITGR